jgi:hypothetical protein
MGGPEMAPHTPRRSAAPRRSRDAPRYADTLLECPRRRVRRREGCGASMEDVRRVRYPENAAAGGCEWTSSGRIQRADSGS